MTVKVNTPPLYEEGELKQMPGKDLMALRIKVNGDIRKYFTARTSMQEGLKKMNPSSMTSKAIESLDALIDHLSMQQQLLCGELNVRRIEAWLKNNHL